MAKEVNLGVLGCLRGTYVAKMAMPFDGLTVKAICDIKPDRLNAEAEAFEKKRNTKVLTFESYEEMLKSDIDAVFVASDAPLHTQHVIMALEAGKHVLSEIPTVFSVEEAKQLKAAVKAHPELIYMTAENCCYLDYIGMWKKMYEDGRFGSIVYAESEYLHCSRTPEEAKPYENPNHWRAFLPGIRYLTHNLGPLLYVMDDEVVSASCHVPDTIFNPYVHENKNGIALFKTKKGAVIRILICFDAYVHFDHNFALYGTHGMVMTDKTSPFENKKVFTRLADTKTADNRLIELSGHSESGGGHGNIDAKVMREFIRCVQENRQPELDVDWGIKVSLAGLIAEQSYKNGNACIKMPEV